MENVSKTQDPEINLAIISTYPDMSKVFEQLAEREGITPFVTCAALTEAAAAAKKIASQIDVILSRGGTADYIKSAVDVPVVSVPITPFDVARSVYAVKNRVRQIAFFNYRQNMYGIRDIETMFGVKISEYTFVSEEEIELGIKKAKAKGADVVIGGIVTVKLAEKHGLASVLIECGEEAAYRSMYEAIHVAQVRRTERSRAVRFKTVLDSIAEGIIVTDEQNKVSIFNPAAERIFRIPAQEIIGRKVQQVIPNTRMHVVFASGKAEVAELQKVHGTTIATSRVPVLLDNERIGVVSTFEDVTKIQQMEEIIRRQIHAKGFAAKYNFSSIITANAQVAEIKELASFYAATDASVLIQGESGTGKELFAQSIHNASSRRRYPFVAINCAAIPEHLLESELFGYEGGAFTGARKEGKQGLFELGHKGTIFLDEIGEIPRMLQARLLRVLQEKEIMRIGGNKIMPVDIRIISATNKDLPQKVAQGEFRDDLYYRLNVFKIKIPPLRDRGEDIILLARTFLERFGVKVEPAQLAEIKIPLLNYNWPGNIRELHNIMERLSLLIKRSQNRQPWRDLLQKVISAPATEDGTLLLKVNLNQGLKQAVGQAEKLIVDTVLNKYDHDYEEAAKFLKIGRTSIWRKSGSKKIAGPSN